MRSPCCLCVCVPSNVARQLFSKYVPTARNKHATIKELLEVVFSVVPVLYQIICSESVCVVGAVTCTRIAQKMVIQH
jgi:hypothetical protein